MTPTRLLPRTPLQRARVVSEYGAGALVELERRCSFHCPQEVAEPIVLAGLEGTLKRRQVPLGRSLRLGLRRWLLGTPAPCEAESAHLTWMRKRLFRAAEPLGSVTIHRLGFPCRELLVTRRVEGAQPFHAAVVAAPPPRRARLFAELGREVGRMHALRFLHAELYPRNVLVTEPCDQPGPGFGRSLIWRGTGEGGPTAWRRGNLGRVEDDLGAWFSRAADWMRREDADALLLAYAASRLDNGRPVESLPGLVRSIQRSRRRELARLERSPGGLGQAAFPVAGWDPDVGRLLGLWSRGGDPARSTVVSPPPVV